MPFGPTCTRAASRLIVSSAASTPKQLALGRRGVHATRLRNAITNFTMPAMSPTMTEGGIAQWKFKEGDSFHAGDVLLEVETDKATIDVEAQDDGILGRIFAPNGSKNIPIGRTIALIAEEGDDISNLEVPREETSKAPQKSTEESNPSPSKTSQSALTEPTPQPVHQDMHIQLSKRLFPSVQRLLVEHGIENADEIKGTGVRGMLTKGDILAFLGKISSPLGTYKPLEAESPVLKQAKEEYKPLNGQALRQLIATNLQSSLRARSMPPSVTPYDFDSIITDYLTPDAASSASNLPPSKSATSVDTYFNGLL